MNDIQIDVEHKRVNFVHRNMCFVGSFFFLPQAVGLQWVNEIVNLIFPSKG